MRAATPLLPILMLLGSCHSPPKPPAVDESTRRPANSAASVELQGCRNDLQNARILLNETARAALAARQIANRAQEAPAARGGRNVVYSILFRTGSARFELDPAMAARLLGETRTAPLILLRGRTDGTTASAAETRVAQARAAAVETWLVHAGVEPARIRTTWQPVGDHAADNTLPGGRVLNRRVEIEIYQAAPEVVALNGGPEGPATPSLHSIPPSESEVNHGR